MAQLNIGDSRVIESREVSDGVTIRRRRESPDGKRFTAIESLSRSNNVRAPFFLITARFGFSIRS